MVLVGKFSFQGDMGGPKNEKNARKNGFSTITFICYSNYLKNQNRSLKYIVLKSSMDTFCNIRFKFREYKQKRVQEALKNEKSKINRVFHSIIFIIYIQRSIAQNLTTNNCVSFTFLISYMIKDYDSGCQSQKYCYKRVQDAIKNIKKCKINRAFHSIIFIIYIQRSITYNLKTHKCVYFTFLISYMNKDYDSRYESQKYCYKGVWDAP